MKVIKKGNGAKGWSKKLECTGSGNKGGGCTAILLVTEHDLFQTGKHYHDGSSDYYITFKCSECGVLTDVDPKICNKNAYDLPSFKAKFGQSDPY